MNEKQNQLEQNNSSMWTQTQRKQSNQEQDQIIVHKQKNSKIFKYPYLLERSSQKFRQHLNSDKSAQDLKYKKTARKKIFQTRSTLVSNLKESSFSADRNRNLKFNNFQNNPIQFKMRNSKQKSSRMKKSYQSTNNNQYAQHQNQKRQGTSVFFNYSSPKNYDRPTVSVSKISHINSILLKPTKQPIVNPPINYSTHETQNLVQRPVVYFSHLLQPQNINNLSPINIAKIETFQNKLQNQSFLNLSQNKNLQMESCYQKNPIASVQSPSRLKQMIPNINLSPISAMPVSINDNSTNAKLISFRPINNYQSCAANSGEVKQIMHIPRIIQQKKSLFREYPEVGSQQTIIPNMYQTYKISQKFLKNPVGAQNRSLLATPKKANSPIKCNAQNYKQRLNNKISCGLQSLSQAKNCHSQSDRQFDQIYQENKYSDRFFDMDFSDNNTRNQALQKVHQIPPMHHKQSLQSQLESANHISKVRESRKLLDQKMKNEVLVKRGSITSILFQKQRQKSNKGIEEGEKRLFKPYSFNQNDSSFNKTPAPYSFATGLQNALVKVDKQGRAISLILISLGLVLVILQMIK